MLELEDRKVDVKIKISALWVTLLFCFIYCDYFELYVPGKLNSMISGKILPIGEVTQLTLVGTAILLIVPSLMVFLTLVLPAHVNRVINIVLASLQGLMLLLLVFSASWYFYKLFAAVETVLAITIVVYAFRWPKSESA